MQPFSSQEPFSFQEIVKALLRNLKNAVCLIDNDNHSRATCEKQTKDFIVTDTGGWWQLCATGLVKAKELRAGTPRRG